MNTQEIKIGTTLAAKSNEYEMVVYAIEEDGYQVRVFGKGGFRQTGTRFVPNHEVKFFDVK